YYLAEWESAVEGTPARLEATQRAQADYMRFWADGERYQAARRFDEQGSADPEAARQARLIYLTAAQNQQDDATIERLTALESDVRGRYTNFRGRVDGRELSDNAMDEVLAKSTDSEEVRRVWEASKQIGQEVAALVRELARVRNEAARRQGFRDHFQRSLTLNEIDEAQLLSLFETLAAESRQPFERLLARLGPERARHFGIAPEQLRPWHFGDRFFQLVPPLGAFDFDGLFADKDPVELATTTYDGLGMDVRPVLARSDLYPRAGKNQHAFMTHIDRLGDIRTLNNLERNHRWNETLHHELGHAVYELLLDPQLPWLLRTPAHILSTEAIAFTMGSLTLEQEWLTAILGIPAAQAEAAARAAADRQQAQALIFTRWCLVMTNFERMMYADPEADLDTLWWDLVERFQGLRRPEGRRAPDWAAKYHVALVPVYYQNYELGHLVRAQIVDRILRHAGGFVGRKAAGEWLRDRYFRSGARQAWSAHIATATGEPLNPRYFVDRLG
ncbi:MAG TPA: M2 family metallopeptidase, partial [Anaerolineales bacterium]|nr:M2 family metallopeptidase [Anaerolineales bacterium]